MTTHRLRLRLLLLALGLGAACQPEDSAGRASSSVAAQESHTSADAAAALQRALSFLHSLPACRMIATPPGYDGLTLEVRVATGQFRVTAGRGENVFARTVSDGRQMLAQQWKEHAISGAPTNFQAWLGSGPAARFFGFVTIQGLWGGADNDRSLVNAKNVVARGVETIGGQPCLHLAVLDPDLECEIWVQQGDEAWIRRFRPRPDDRGVMDYTSGDMALEDNTTWSRDLPADSFAMIASQDSVLVEALAQEREAEPYAVDATDAELEAAVGDVPIIDEAGQLAAAEEGPHPSQGKPAPDVTITLLDNSTVRLADLRGKVVVLDFWATWCPPCVAGLPKVAALTKGLAERGVVMYALNLEQTPRTVRRHLEASKLDVLTAVVDKPILAAFGVSGVPHTVVIDAHGVIRKVHVGFTPGDEKMLEQEVLAALGSSSPAPKAASTNDK